MSHSLQDIFALSSRYNKRPAKEETINDPTNPRHYWRYRMHMTLEDLNKDIELQALLSGMVKEGDRGHRWWKGKETSHTHSMLVANSGLEEANFTSSSDPF